MAKPKILIDSNILIDGIRSNWSAAKALLIMMREVDLFQVFISKISVEEVEDFLIRNDQETFIDDYINYLKLVKVIELPPPSQEIVLEYKKDILPALKHLADLPIAVTAIQNDIDWIISNNREHFSEALSKKTGIKITSASEFLMTVKLYQ